MGNIFRHPLLLFQTYEKGALSDIDQLRPESGLWQCCKWWLDPLNHNTSPFNFELIFSFIYLKGTNFTHTYIHTRSSSADLFPKCLQHLGMVQTEARSLPLNLDLYMSSTIELHAPSPAASRVHTDRRLESEMEAGCKPRHCDTRCVSSVCPLGS